MHWGDRSHDVLPVLAPLSASYLEEVEGAEGTLCAPVNTEMRLGFTCAPCASWWGMVLALPGVV